MACHNSSLQHRPGQYVVDNSDKTSVQVIGNAVQDIMHVWLGESSLKLWIRVWLAILWLGCMSPLAFLPHPFAITNLVAMFVIVGLDGQMVVEVRGVNKNMGWPHLVGWIPVLVINILSLTTDSIGWGDYGDKLTWENAGTSAYEKVRFVVVIFNTVTLATSCAFDTVDTFLYYARDEQKIERSRWTTDQLTLLVAQADDDYMNKDMDQTDTNNMSVMIDVVDVEIDA